MANERCIMVTLMLMKQRHITSLLTRASGPPEKSTASGHYLAIAWCNKTARLVNTLSWAPMSMVRDGPSVTIGCMSGHTIAS